jgi:hypothetical protein
MKKILIIFIMLIPVIPLFAQSVLKITPGTTLKTTNNAFIVLNNASLNNNGIIQQTISSGTFKFTGANNDTMLIMILLKGAEIFTWIGSIWLKTPADH